MCNQFFFAVAKIHSFNSFTPVSDFRLILFRIGLNKLGFAVPAELHF